MNSYLIRTVFVWLTATALNLPFQKSLPPSQLKALSKDLLIDSEVDYVVIGRLILVYNIDILCDFNFTDLYFLYLKCSGIGGLSCAAMLVHYGYKVRVLESHYLPGGVAHTFERDGFKVRSWFQHLMKKLVITLLNLYIIQFDAGPSLWNGMATRPYNPLREVRLTAHVMYAPCDHLSN